MKRIIKFSFLIVVALFITTGCYFNAPMDTQSAISLVQNDMAKITTTIRSLDNIYLEDYAINEISPSVNYNTFNNMDYSTNYSDNISARVSAPAYNNQYSINYSYNPKYIDNVNSLDSSYLLAYLQSMQDLFLITSDITAANQVLNELSYNIINETVNVRNNAYMLNYNLNELTQAEIQVLQEYSTTINNAINNIKYTSGNITNEVKNLSSLRTNFYKNTETLNAKYINILNVLDTRITQLKNIQAIIERLNNQILLMSDVHTYRNNNYNDNSQIDNNHFGIDNNSTFDNNIVNDGSNYCHQCHICDKCGNCINCDNCEICPICGKPSICDGNCNNIYNNEILNNDYNLDNSLSNLHNNDKQNENTLNNNLTKNIVANDDDTTLNNNLNNQLNDDAKYKNYNDLDIKEPLINNDTTLNYESYSIYD